MKKNLLLTILIAFITGVLYAQSTIVEKPIKNTQSLKSISAPAPAPAPAPSPTSKTAAPATKTDVPASVYSLTSVRVNIRTGNDNKEFPSEVGVMLRNRGCDNGGWIMQQLPGNMRNEMKKKAVELGDEADWERTKVDFWEYY